MRIASLIPALEWGRRYNRLTFSHDLTAACVVTMMMIPQSLAYALLAGLPPQLGLYASILPLLLYAVFGTSCTLSVGPFTIASIMTATTLEALFPQGSALDYLAGASVLALLSGVMLMLFGLFRLGFLCNFLSFPVVTGFISATAIITAVNQLDHLLGVSARGSNLREFLPSFWEQLEFFNPYTLAVGLFCMLLLKLLPSWFAEWVIRRGARPRFAGIMAKMVPLLVMLISILVVRHLDLAESVAVVGEIPAGLPSLQLPPLEVLSWPESRWQHLISSAALISLIGYVSSLSVAQMFATQRRRRIDPDQEAIGLGLANIGSGLSGAFPVSASVSRSTVNLSAGAESQAAGGLTAIGVALATLFVTDLLHDLPLAMLAAMILLAFSSLINLSGIRQVWRYNKSDFVALILTAALTLTHGVEVGLFSGVLVSILLYLYRSSHPHVAVVGKMPGSEHFRNCERYNVEMNDNVISFRMDASLYFANARFLEDKVNELIAEFPKAKHMVLVCSSVSEVDSSALVSLRVVDYLLRAAGMKFHLSEVKGPVMDSLVNSDFLEKLSGRVFVSHYDAWLALKGDAEQDYAITDAYRPQNCQSCFYKSDARKSA